MSVARVILVLALPLAACGGSADSSAGPAALPTVTSVSVSLSPSSIPINGRASASAIPRSREGTALVGRGTSWSSGNPAVASVDASGTVTGLASGTADIIATIEGKSGSATLTVVPPPPISVLVTNLLDVPIRIGTEETQATRVTSGSTVTLSVPGTTTTLKWVSEGRSFSDGSRIADDLAGASLPIAAQVTISSRVGEIQYFSPKIFQLISQDTISVGLVSNSANRCVANIWGSTLANGFGLGYYKSEADLRISVFGGRSCNSARLLGSLSVTNPAPSANGVIRVEVASAYPTTSVRVSPNSVVLGNGEMFSFKYSAIDAIGRDLGSWFSATKSWRVSSPGVASINSEGLLTALAPGVTTVTSTIVRGDGSQVTGSANVVVSSSLPPVARVEVCDGQYLTLCPSVRSLSAFTPNGFSFNIVARAYSQSGVNITDQCAFVWSSSPAYRVEYNGPSNLAIVTYLGGLLSSSIRATCRGVSGFFQTQ
jgi:uncharacterized protein YjdB